MFFALCQMASFIWNDIFQNPVLTTYFARLLVQKDSDQNIHLNLKVHLEKDGKLCDDLYSFLINGKWDM
jgi:hypothetical protein